MPFPQSGAIPFLASPSLDTGATQATIDASITTHAALNPGDGVHGITAATTAPVSPATDDLWVDTTA